jgi:ATP-dependent RNA helicase RhlE
MTPQTTPHTSPEIQAKPSTLTFDGLGIAPKILEILDRLKFTTPTPIQFQSIPQALTGKDIMGIAQTGTGKTLAFGIPMIQRLATTKGKGLIILPTRELAIQVDESIAKIGRPLGLRTAILIGGENMGKQIRQLRLNPHIIIATPGRLIDHLEQRTVTVNTVTTLVLDEADRMLDMGFAPQIKKILQTVPKERQTMLFSATMPAEIVNIANSYMQLPVRVEVAPAGTAGQNVTQELFFVHREDKSGLLETLLKEYKGSVLVFSRTKFGAKKIANNVRRMGHTATEIHSNRSLSQRIEALNGFKVGKYRVLIATDIAARGIDVTGIELVVNYDLPEQAADYVHRIGRTGRAGHSGHAISFATSDQKFDVRAIERLIKKQLPISTLPTLPARQQPAPVPSGGTSFGGYHSPNRQPQESFGNRGHYRPSAAPKPLRSPFARRTKPTGRPFGKPQRHSGTSNNYSQNNSSYGSRNDSQF